MVGCSSCHEEPTIVIRFEPNDSDVAPSPQASIASAPVVAASPAPAAVAKRRECKVAADCVAEPEECCDCMNGGKLHAVAKAHALTKEMRAQKCSGIMCPTMVSNDPSCAKKAACVSGQCVMK
jgi:hypothetical protein